MILFELFIIVLGSYILCNIILPNFLQIIGLLGITIYFNIPIYEISLIEYTYILYKLGSYYARPLFDFLENIIRYPVFINNLFIYMDNKINKMYQLVNIFKLLYQSIQIKPSNLQKSHVLTDLDVQGSGVQDSSVQDQVKNKNEESDDSDIDNIFY